MFGFQKLDVYRCAMTFLGVASALAERIPRGHSALAEQLRRAALSVPLNIAEGSGKGTMKDREARRAAAAAGNHEADQGLLRLCGRDKLPSPDAARSFLLGFHDEKLLSLARSENPTDEASVIYPDSAALLGLARVQEHIVAKMSHKRPQPVATLEMDATIIESHKKEALPHYKGGRGYQPSLVYWVEQDLVVSDQFRDGNVPAGKAPLDVVKRAFAARTTCCPR